MREFNIFPHTQIGFIDVQKKLIHNKQNRSHYEHYTIGGQYLEDLQSLHYAQLLSLNLLMICNHITTVSIRIQLVNIISRLEFVQTLRDIIDQ